MFCAHCGKKVTDMMLFCPFCGEPIVIPDQDDAVDLPQEQDSPRPEPVPEPEPAAQVPDEPMRPATEADDAAAELLNWNWDRRSIAEDEEAVDAEAETNAFTPLRLEQDEEDVRENWREALSRKKQEAAPERKAPEIGRAEGQTARLEGRAPRLEENGNAAQSRRAANTYVPAKAMNPDDMFMDGKADAYDEYDDYDAYDNDEDYDDGDYAYEDEAAGSFFMRHIRGLVGLTLFIILILMFAIYAFSDAGQRSLARVNLAWKTEVYASLGYESYQSGQYNQAGQFYERALARDPENYSHASSAAMAYVTGENTEKAASMLKKCIEINPNQVEPYVYLLNLYPEAANRPWDVTQLIQKGYELTGDSRLNVTG